MMTGNEAEDKININLIDLARSIHADSYFDFLKDFWECVEPHELTIAPYIEFLCKEVQIIFEQVCEWEKQKDSYDLLINIAPGTTKSTIVSKFGPAYLWTKNPDVTMIAVSYSAKIVKEFTHKFNRLLNSDKFRKFYPEMYLRKDDVEEQHNNKKGIRYTTSVGGSVTGMHGDIIIVDDLNKPPRIKRDQNGVPRLIAGATLTEINTGNSWHDDVLVTRKTDNERARTIYIQQRVHENDSSGYLLRKAKQGAIDLKHICLPAQIKTEKAFMRIYRDGDIVDEKDLGHLYREKLLDPIRMGQDTLAKKEKTMGISVFNAQFLQRPSRDKAGIIKTKFFEIVDRNAVPDNLVKFFYSDTSEGKVNSDSMATGCWSLYEGSIYIWEVVTAVLQFPDFIGRYNSSGVWEDKFYDSFVKRHGQTSESIHVFEAKSTGTPYMQYINKATPYNAQADMPKGSKLDRVYASRPRIESGRVKLIEGPWIESFLEECQNFTGEDGGTDDQVDVLTGMIKMTSFHGSVFTQSEEDVQVKDEKKNYTNDII